MNRVFASTSLLKAFSLPTFSAAILSILAMSAQADTQSSSGYYAGGSVSRVSIDVTDNHWTSVEAFGGYKYNPFVGGEVRLGTSVSGDPKIKNYEAIYYRTESANNTAKAYLLVGYAHGSVDIGDGDSRTLSGLSYGAGVGFVLNDRFNLNLEYRSLVRDKGDSDKGENKVELSGASVTVDYRF